MADGGGANYGLGKHEQDFLTPAGRGVIVDPPDGILPMQQWAKAEVESRKTPERGYDDPTAHCFVAGVPRSMYVPVSLQILQPPGYVVILHERMSWRTIPLDGRATPAGPFAVVAGRLDRPVGRRYAGRRHDEPEWEDVVERGGRDRQPCRARGRALHADRRRHDPLRGDRLRSARVHASMDDRLPDKPAGRTSSWKWRVTKTTRICNT